MKYFSWTAPPLGSAYLKIIFQVFGGWSNKRAPFHFALAGVPHEVLSMDFWVPGSTTRQELDRFKGKKVFKEILTPTKETAMLYFSRATQDFGFVCLLVVFPYCLNFFFGICAQPCKDFTRKVGKDATTKTKELGQSVSQTRFLTKIGNCHGRG